MLQKNRLISFIALILSALMVFGVTVIDVGASTSTVDISKTIVAEDINWANGNPTFIYELSTYAGSTGTAKYSALIVFTQGYVESNTAADGTVTITTSITNVAPDEYVLTEQDSLRYQTTVVSNVVNGEAYNSYWKELSDGTWVEIPRMEVEFNLKKNNYGAATFNGIKTNWADASHTSVQVNEFKYTGALATP